MDAVFVKKEANWYRASLRYDNLSRLPPASLSKSNPDWKKTFHNHYFTDTDGGPVSNFYAIEYQDPWPVPYKLPKPQKKSSPESEAVLTAGIPPKDREVFNEELRDFMREHFPSEVEEVDKFPDPIVTKIVTAERAKKATISREKRTAAKARSIMPAHQHDRNTRLKAKAAEAIAAADALASAGDAAGTQDATTAVPASRAPDAPVAEDTVRSRQLSAPPYNLFMRDSRAAMSRNAFMSRPVRGVVSDSYYAAAMTKAYNHVYRKAMSVGDEPIGNDLPRDRVLQQGPAADKPEPFTNTAVAEEAAPEKAAVPQPPKSMTTKKSAPTKSVPSKPATSKAASTDNVDNGLAKDKSAYIKLPRAAKACDPCRAHKTRCTGGTPCEACARRGFACVYVPGGKKAPTKRARDDSEDVARKEPVDDDAEQENHLAKRARKETATPTQKATPTEKATPTKKIILTKKATPAKKSVDGSNGMAGATHAQPLDILPSIEEVPEDNGALKPQPSQKQQFSQPKIAKIAKIQPIKTTSSYSDRVTRSRSRQLSEEAEAQNAKLQSKGKRVREESSEPTARPAKLQRATKKGPDDHRKPGGNPQILRAIISREVDHDGNALMKSPWEDLFFYDSTWMCNTFLNWEKSLESFDRPDLNVKSQDESFHARPSIKLVMTDVLKGILVDDWEHVTKDSQLVPLPHEQPVVNILKDYLEDEMPKREADSAQADILKETIAGLREYFDRALGRILLYRFERLQYSEMLPEWENDQDKGPSNVYGGEHLCRLLVSLPELLAQTNMDQQSVSRLREELTKFTNWLSKNGQKYFVREYEVPGQEYQEKAKSS